MKRVAGWLLVLVLAALSGSLAGPAGADPQPNTSSPSGQSPPPAAKNQPAHADNPAGEHPPQPPTTDDICRTLEQAAAENQLPVEFLARVIWQESRFNARAVSNKGAQGIAQFMPQTADFRGLADPFDPIEALRNAASYLHDLRVQFGNLGLAAAGYNAGPGRVRAWLAGHRTLPGETRNYVAVITGWTADEWASATPPATAETMIPQGVPCTRLANVMLAPKEEAHRTAAYVPKWGAQLTANWSESKAWGTYRILQRRYAVLIGDREPIVLRSRAGPASATRYEIRISDDDRGYLEKFCAKLIAAGGACVVLKNLPVRS